MDDARIESAEIDWTIRFLARADLAKFAKTMPAADEARDDLGAAREFVERTRFLGDDPDEGDGPDEAETDEEQERGDES